MYIISFNKSHHTWLRRLRLTAGSLGLAAIPGCPKSGSKRFISTYAVNVTVGFYSPHLQTVLEMFSFGTQKRTTSYRTRCFSHVEVFVCEQRMLPDKIMCLQKGQAKFWICDICKLNIPSTAVSLTQQNDPLEPMTKPLIKNVLKLNNHRRKLGWRTYRVMCFSKSTTQF
jgi:hypothetical protein